MRKHRVLTGILAAIILVGMVPSALAAETVEYKGGKPGQIDYDGILLDKTATDFNSEKETTINLMVSAPSAQNPVAVEFVLDGTSSLHDAGDLSAIKNVAEQVRSTFAKNENVYVGVTVFGRVADTVLTMRPVPAAINADLADSTAELLKNSELMFGSNIQAGLQAGIADMNAADLPKGTDKYMVLVTDGGSYWWMNDGKAVNNSCNGKSMQNSDAADGGYEKLASLKDMKGLSSAPVDYTSTAGEPLADVLGQIKADADKYTNFETGVYFAAQELKNIPADTNLITVGRPYYEDNASLKALTDLAAEFVDVAADMDKTGISGDLYDVGLSDALTKVTGQLNVAVPAGSTIVDYIGKTQTNRGETEAYNFDVVTNKEFVLRIGTQPYTATLNANNEATFGDGSKLVYTPGADEHFVLTLAHDMDRSGKVSLTYTAKLVDYDKSGGKHNVLTNVQAYLNPKGTDDGLLFPEPSLGYRINGGGGGGEVIPDPDVPGADLNETDHYAYIIGRKDGLVHPEAQITRGEVATIYFRMLTDESRNRLWSQSNPYTDIQPDTWCNAAVSTMTRAGVIEGFSDGTFRPYAPITRAQFATIAVRFFDVVYAGDDKFSDIADHWAKDYINKAAEAALINGFSDGTFRPNQPITRAQAMAIFNRVLGRAPDGDHMLPGMITWPDNMDKNAWYYANMQEATNSHEYEIKKDSEGKPYEVWTKMLPVRDWAAFENEWATVNSAANPGEVISVPVDKN